MIYFDNAATTYSRPHIIRRSMNKYLKSANPGRSGHKLSIKASEMIYDTRVKLRDFFCGYSEENVIFTANCTEALNLAILGSVKEHGHVITSCFEHNSVLRPLKHLESNNIIKLSIIEPQYSSHITLNDIKKAIRPDTYLVALTHISNVTGNRNDIEDICRYCADRGILTLVDAAQSTGHVKIDMASSKISMLAFAGHKGLLAPAAIGGLITNGIKLEPLKHGGTGTNSIELYQPDNSPERYESGTLPTPLIAGLNAGVSYVSRHIDRHMKKASDLTRYLLRSLSQDPKYTIYTDRMSEYGVVAFNIKGYDSVDVSSYLDKNNIYVRSGLHCAPLTHRYLGTVSTGVIRVSMSYRNNKRQIDKMLKILKAFK